MSTFNLHTPDPAENAEEQRIYQLLKESLDAPGKTYDSVADFIAEMRASLLRK